jgi:NAD(P)H dehydrogenase (quinone)
MAMERMSRREALQALSLGLALTACPLASIAAAADSGKIIISGASGRLGQLTVKALLDRGVPAQNLILVSRTPAALQEYRKLGADIRAGDFTRPESLPVAFTGGTRMLLISIGLGQGSRPVAHQRAIDAAKAAGVKQIAYTSWIGVAKGETRGVAPDHLATEEILKKSGVAWTFLRNSVYMDGVIPDAVAMLADGKASVPVDEYKVDYVTRGDCAAAAAAVLTTPGHDNKAYEITGPELVGVREIATAVSAVTGKVIVVTPQGSNTPAAASADGASSAPGTAVAELTGRPATSLKTFLAANRDRLVPSAR